MISRAQENLSPSRKSRNRGIKSSLREKDEQRLHGLVSGSSLARSAGDHRIAIRLKKPQTPSEEKTLEGGEDRRPGG